MMDERERHRLKAEMEARGWDVIEEADDGYPVLAVRDHRPGRLRIACRFEAEMAGFVPPRR
jgi:hypothetical protein